MPFRWTTIVILLVAGVILSVVVAWRCAMFSWASVKNEDLDSNYAKSLWVKYVNTPINRNDFEASRFEGTGLTEIDLSVSSSESNSIYFSRTCALIKTGWPLRCLERERHYSVDPNYVSKVDDVATFILPQKLGPVYWGGRQLPLRVLWVGMIFNTLCYAFLCGLFFVALQKLRQRTRLDLKHCPQCNYSLCKSIKAEGATCSECSHQISIKLFERPRFLLRRWMVPMLLPLVAFFIAWIVGLVNWYQLRFYLHWEYPITEWKVLISLLISILFIYEIAFSAYTDRSANRRVTIACVVALILSVLVYLPIHMLAVIYETWP